MEVELCPVASVMIPRSADNLGSDIATVKRIVRDDTEAIDMLDRAIGSTERRATNLRQAMPDVKPVERPALAVASCDGETGL